MCIFGIQRTRILEEEKQLNSTTQGQDDTTIQIVVTPGSGEGRALRTALHLRRLLENCGRRAAIEPFRSLEALGRWAQTPPSFSHLLCIGGDATLSAAAPAAITRDVPFVPVPNGFGNVFAQVFGHPERAAAVVKLIESGEIRRVDVGRAKDGRGEELFLSHRSYGFLDRVQEEAERGRQQPRHRLLRHLAYYGMAYRLLFRIPLESFQVEVDGHAVADDAVLVTVANVETYRGFLPLTPTASPIDGLFDVFVVPRVSKAGLLTRLVRLMLHLPGRWRGVALYRGRRVMVKTSSGQDELSVWRRALPLLVPPGAIESLRQRTVEDEPPIARP